MFTAEIISIGDELTSGALVDTNSAFLSRELGDLGIPVLCHTTVGDDLAAMSGIFRAALSRSDLVLITGGLGPTEDDLTRQAAADAAGAGLVQDPSVMAHIRGLFELRGRPMPPSNEIQSFFPRGAKVIGNPHGTAPGFAMEVRRGGPVPGAGRAKMLVFPGVPAELCDMWEETGRTLSLDWHCELTGKRYTTVTRVLRTFGADRLGDLVFGEGDATLASVVSEKLAAAGKRLATLEWGTGGFLAQQVPRTLFAGGLVDSGDGLIQRTLGLAAGASLEEALRAWQRVTGAEALLAVGPFPAGEEETLTEQFPVSAAALLDGAYREASYPYGFHPAIVKPVFAARAFDLLRRLLF